MHKQNIPIIFPRANTKYESNDGLFWDEKKTANERINLRLMLGQWKINLAITLTLTPSDYKWMMMHAIK